MANISSAIGSFCGKIALRLDAQGVFDNSVPTKAVVAIPGSEFSTFSVELDRQDPEVIESDTGCLRYTKPGWVKSMTITESICAKFSAPLNDIFNLGTTDIINDVVGTGTLLDVTGYSESPGSLPCLCGEDGNTPTAQIAWFKNIDPATKAAYPYVVVFMPWLVFTEGYGFTFDDSEIAQMELTATLEQNLNFANKQITVDSNPIIPNELGLTDALNVYATSQAPPDGICAFDRADYAATGFVTVTTIP